MHTTHGGDVYAVNAQIRKMRSVQRLALHSARPPMVVRGIAMQCIAMQGGLLWRAAAAAMTRSPPAPRARYSHPHTLCALCVQNVLNVRSVQTGRGGRVDRCLSTIVSCAAQFTVNLRMVGSLNP